MKRERTWRQGLRYLVEFTGEHPTLPIEELRASAEAEREHFTIVHLNNRMAILESDDLSKAMKRCALIRTVSVTCDHGPFSELLDSNAEELGNTITRCLDVQFPKAGSFRITPRKLGGKYPDIDIGDLIDKLAANVPLPVSLDEPDIEVLLFLAPSPPPPTSTPSPPTTHSTKKTSPTNPSTSASSSMVSPNLHYYIGVKIHENQREQFGEREVKYRPFFSPISLPPVFARVCVNLSRIPLDGRLLDPFCGTGGILLESTLLEIATIGTDLDEDMLRGAEANLKHFSLDAELYRSDIGDLPMVLKKNGICEIHGIATDMPYGRASSTFGEKINELIDRTLDSFHRILQTGTYAVLVTSSGYALRLRHKSLTLVSCHRLRVHGSLNRYFIVYQKIDSDPDSSIVFESCEIV